MNRQSLLQMIRKVRTNGLLGEPDWHPSFRKRQNQSASKTILGNSNSLQRDVTVRMANHQTPSYTKHKAEFI